MCVLSRALTQLQNKNGRFYVMFSNSSNPLLLDYTNGVLSLVSFDESLEVPEESLNPVLLNGSNIDYIVFC